MTVQTQVKIKPRLYGFKELLTHQALRRTVQLAFAIFIIATIWVHTGTEGTGVITASAEAYCPFGGLETLYQYVISGGSYIPHTHLSNLVVAAAVLIVALLMRSAFCGWICPLGFLQDLVANLRGVIERRVPAFRRWMNNLRSWGAENLSWLDRALRYLKYAVLIWAISGAAIYSVMVFRDYDPWAALISITEFSLTPGFIVLLITLIASFFVERAWCRYACPLGAISGIVGKASPVYLQRESDACTNCKICTKACPMGLNVHTANTITSVDCVTCLECVGECPREGALNVKVGIPFTAK